MIKSFFITVFILGGFVAAGYFLYEPYIEPLLSRKTVDVSGDKPATPKKPESKEGKPAPKKAPSGKVPAEKAVVKKQSPPKSEIDRLLEKKYPMPAILPLDKIVQNWKMVPPNAYPKEVIVNETVAFDLIVNGQKIGSSSVAPGKLWKPVRLVGDQLTVSSLANPGNASQVHVDKTDFKQRITKRYNDFVKQKTEQVMSRRSKAKKIIEAKDGLLAMLKGSGPADDSSDPRFRAVKASIKAGECPTVQIEEARSYKWNGSEKIEGPFAGTYNTATVHFEVKTIFGKFPIDCKALLRGGKVVVWIDPITGEKI